MNPSSPYSVERVTQAAWKLARLISICESAELVRYRKLFTTRTAAQHNNAWDRYELLILRRKRFYVALQNLLTSLGDFGADEQVDQILVSIPAWSKAARSLTLRNPGNVAGSDGARAIGCFEVATASNHGLRNI